MVRIMALLGKGKIHFVVISCIVAAFTSAQGVEESVPSKLIVEPKTLSLRVGESAKLDATVLDAAGNTLDVPILFLPLYGQFWNLEHRTWGFNIFKVRRDGEVVASRPGEYAIMVRVPKDANARSLEDEAFLQQEVPLTILPPPINRISFVDVPKTFFVGTRFQLDTRAWDAEDLIRRDEVFTYTSTAPLVAKVSSRGSVALLDRGKAIIKVESGDVSTTLEINVVDNPISSLDLRTSSEMARTGDVLRFNTIVKDKAGAVIPSIPVSYSFAADTDPLAVGGPSSGFIMQDGRFVADLPGQYTITATSGGISNSISVEITPRNVKRHVELVGHGRVSDRATSDLWVWEGVDGNDYAITGTHNASGHAFIWDVTDPANMVVIDTVHVDARTVNDVKVSKDGRTAVISREGASNRRNGIVLLDVSSPKVGVRILSNYDNELTGGVHNVFVYDEHVYALSAGQRYDIISIEDPTQPHRVGRFALSNPDRSIHDVVVKDGIAYSANWNDGVVVVDVGGGDRGGSLTAPVQIGKFPFPTGWNHAIYPYRSVSTGKFYIFAGDEAARTGKYSPQPEKGTGTPGYEGEGSRWRGWIHVLNWDDDGDPEIVARYEVPEAGSHNIWVENDVMYVGFYNGGLRIVDVSGELMGNLYSQGREIGRFLPFDPKGFKPNAPKVWGAQPHKGTIFFSDYNSGLWAVKVNDGIGVVDE